MELPAGEFHFMLLSTDEHTKNINYTKIIKTDMNIRI